jgi:tRNA-dihydrouridine synthase
MSIYDELPKPFFVLAPMDDVTDSVFRRVMAGTAAPDLYFTEFVNVDGLQSPGRQHLLKKLYHTAEERPIIAQLWGKNPENFKKTAAELAEMGFAGVDLNMGCPAKSEVNNGTCSALINNRPLAVEIIKATQEGAADKLPVSVKTRLGFSNIDMTWPELLLQQKLSMLTIHGRTRKEMSKVPAHWDEIGRVRELRDSLQAGSKLNTLIVGNGDVRDRKHGMELVEKYKLDGIMIGRGVFADPFAFALPTGQGLTEQTIWESHNKQQRLVLYKKHVQLFAETWQNNERPIHTLNKFCKIYISGFDGAKELREELMEAKSTDELLNILAVDLLQH